MTIRVLLDDDRALLRATFRLLLDSTTDIQVVAEAATGTEAIEKAGSGVDVILMDIRMPDVDGIEATRRITADPNLAGPASRPRTTPDLAALTARELQIVTLVGTGLSNTEIAAELFISVATAKTHVNRAMVTTGARDRAQLVIVTYDHQLVR